jgi:exopolyphosphatase/guanosine-5'-triphosphate,3'-diphosphate pyrophosphatase
MDKLMIAAVDIGSNAARLLIKSTELNKEDSDGVVDFYKELFLRIPIRLGEDVFKNGEISDLKLNTLIHMMKSFRQLMRTFSVTDYRVCATSAMREAKNSKQVVKTVEKESGLKIEIISGEEEAEIVYDKRIEGFEDKLKTYAYVDVGGGSTEVVVVNEGKIIFEKSYRIGTLRMLNAESQDACDFAVDEMKTQLGDVCNRFDKVDIIGSGGNINKLYKLAVNKNKHNSSFSIKSLTDVYELLKPLSIADRMNAFSLRRERADVIIPAAEIFLAIAGVMKSQRVYVPMHGLADGIIDSIYESKVEGGES